MRLGAVALGEALAMVLAASVAWAAGGGKPPPVGVASAVRGEVAVKGSVISAAPRSARSGAGLQVGDTVSTGPDGYVNILLRDESVIAVAPGSAVTLELFVYDPLPAGQWGLRLRMLRGLLRIDPGRCVGGGQGAVVVEMPLGRVSLGVPAMLWATDGKPSLAIRLSSRGSSLADSKLAVFTARSGGVTRKVQRPGFATRLTRPGARPSRPFHLPPKALDVFARRLKPQASGAPKGASTGADGKEPPGSDAWDPYEELGDLLSAKDETWGVDETADQAGGEAKGAGNPE